MVDFGNLQKAQMLSAEKQQIDRALQIFDSGGRIMSLGVGMPPPEGQSQFPSSAFTVSTAYMDYPPQMVEQIKSFMQTRRQQVVSELTSLGITGMDTPPTISPTSAPQEASRATRRR